MSYLVPKVSHAYPETFSQNCFQICGITLTRYYLLVIYLLFLIIYLLSYKEIIIIVIIIITNVLLPRNVDAERGGYNYLIDHILSTGLKKDIHFSADVFKKLLS